MRVPRVLAIVEDVSLIGAPFVLYEHIDGHAVSTSVPADLKGPPAARAISEQLVDALAELHAVNVRDPTLATFGRGDGYLQRQLRRFTSILAATATRPLPDLDRVGRWLAATVPATPVTTLVHGDYRLGNALFQAGDPPRLAAILDWEMATLGDPLTDLGYLTATWAEPGDEENPMRALSAGTRQPGFMVRRELHRRYAERTGRSLGAIGWYETLALWKCAIFLEASYGRFLSGTTFDPYFAALREGVPLLARAARERCARLR
jgi:aminoglycoside phosphotransferase (APT) family kinase protein